MARRVGVMVWVMLPVGLGPMPTWADSSDSTPVTPTNPREPAPALSIGDGSSWLSRPAEGPLWSESLDNTFPHGSHSMQELSHQVPFSLAEDHGATQSLDDNQREQHPLSLGQSALVADRLASPSAPMPRRRWAHEMSSSQDAPSDEEGGVTRRSRSPALGMLNGVSAVAIAATGFVMFMALRRVTNLLRQN